MGDRISHEDPLPGNGEPKSRWAEPYQSSHSPGAVEWTVHLRHALSEDERMHGLRERLVASNLTQLALKMRLQDENHKTFHAEREVPAWKHRAS